MIVDKINKYLNDTHNGDLGEALKTELETLSTQAFNSLFNTEEWSAQGKLWATHAGKCVRNQAYEYLGFPKDGKKFEPRAKIKFFLGHMTEAAVVALAIKAGVPLVNTGTKQTRLELEFSGVRVVCKPDGDISLPNEGINFECKSMNAQGYAAFEGGKISEEYDLQQQICMAAKSQKRSLMFGVNTDTGHFSEQWVHYDHNKYLKAKVYFLQIAGATKESLPAPPEEFSPERNNGYFHWRCAYCPRWKICRPNAARVVVTRKQFNPITRKYSEVGIYKLKPVTNRPH